VEPRAPDLIEPIAGFRRWRLVGDHLTSPFIPLRWEQAVVHARCYPANRTLLFGEGWLDGPHEAPHPECRCGIYAWHGLPAPGPVPDPDRVFGVVSLWGRIEVHADGMRGQHAAIGALGLADSMGPAQEARLRAIAAQLGVQVLAEPELPLVAAEHGSTLPPALMPRAA
jgi:hypothetical protein